MAYVENALFIDSLKGRINGTLSGIADATRKYVAYRRTYAELNALSIDGLLDLGLYRGELKDLAHRAVYGH